MTSSSSVPSISSCADGVPPAATTRSAPTMHLVHHPVVDGGEELLLGADVVVERALAESVDLAELGDAGGVVAAAARTPSPTCRRSRRVAPSTSRCAWSRRRARWSSAATVLAVAWASVPLPFAAGASRRTRAGLRPRRRTRAARRATSARQRAERRRRRSSAAARTTAPAGAHRERRRGGDRGGDLHGGVERGAGFDEPAHEPELVRARGVDGLAGEDRVHRRRAPDRAREPEQPAGGGDRGCAAPRPARTTSAWWRRRRRRRARSPARRRSRARRPRPRSASSRSRYTKPPNPPRSVSSVAAVPVSRMTLRSAPAQNTGRACPSMFAVSTPTRSVGIVLEPVDRRLERERQLAVDRVARLGPVEGDDGDVVGRLVADGGHDAQM